MLCLAADRPPAAQDKRPCATDKTQVSSRVCCIPQRTLRCGRNRRRGWEYATASPFYYLMDCAARLELRLNKSCIGRLRSTLYTILTACISQVECLSATRFPLFLSGAIMKIRLTAPQHFALPVLAWLDGILLLGGLGVEDKQNARIIRYIVLFVGLRRRESLPIKISNTCLAVTFASLFPLTFFGMWSPDCRSECTMRGRMLTFCTKRQRKKVISCHFAAMKTYRGVEV